MRTLTLFALVALTANAGRFDRTNSRCAQGRSDRGLSCDASAPVLLFEFAPTSGEGLPSVQALCSQLADAEKVGSWFCQQGDGSLATGSTVTLTATGSPAAVTPRICPNGPDCTAVSAQQSISASSGYNEGSNVDRSASLTTGGFTQCWHGVLRFSSVEQEPLAVTL